jgi:hypothetical protein
VVLTGGLLRRAGGVAKGLQGCIRNGRNPISSRVWRRRSKCELHPSAARIVLFQAVS